MRPQAGKEANRPYYLPNLRREGKRSTDSFIPSAEGQLTEESAPNGAVAILPLSRGYNAIIDFADYSLVGPWKWSAMVNEYGGVYAWRNGSLTPGKRKYLLLHRVLMGVNDPRILVDHRDGNGLNNRRSNLRICTHEQNSCNRGLHRNKNAANGRFKGIHKLVLKSGRIRWMARIQHKRIHYHLGLFDTQEAAARAYDFAAIQRFGEFASLNFEEDRSFKRRAEE